MICLCLMLAVSCTNNAYEGSIIITEIPADNPGGDFENGLSWYENLPSHLIAIDPGKPGKTVVLSKDFYAVRSPEVSCDAAKLLFAGRKARDDGWQIWEMDLKNKNSRQITAFNENCIDPAYLPGDRFVFSKQVNNEDNQAEYALFTGSLDGTGISRITFDPHANFAPTVLKDGRVVTISRQLFPETGQSMYMVMRPDGTKAMQFYTGKEGTEPVSRAWETAGAEVLFIESSPDGSTGSLMSVHQNRPLNSVVNVSAGIEGSFRYVFPMQTGEYLISYRFSYTDKYSLYKFDPEKRSPGKLIYSNPYFHAVEAVEVAKIEKPRDLPSEVNEEKETGLLFCQDINISGNPSEDKSPGIKKAKKIQVSGMKGLFGEVDVEEDGSFYLKVMADTAFQIRTLDENGEPVHGPSAWIWIRPNERRGCVGCHEDPELVPANRVPMAVKKPPVPIPVQN